MMSAIVLSSFDNGVEVFSGATAAEVDDDIKTWLNVNRDYEIISHNLQAWTENATSWHKNHVIVTIQWRIIRQVKEPSLA